MCALGLVAAFPRGARLSGPPSAAWCASLATVSRPQLQRVRVLLYQLQGTPVPIALPLHIAFSGAALISPSSSCESRSWSTSPMDALHVHVAASAFGTLSIQAS